jgi:Family of unknown function (DUF6252)
MNKTAILLLCTLFAGIVMLSSCSKTLDQPGYPGFRCAFGNQEYVADSAIYKTRESGVTGTEIYAYTAGNPVFKFYLLRNSAGQTADSTGTYVLDSTFNVAYCTTGGVTYRSISGSLSISQYYNDSLKMITGTFYFDGREPGSSGKSLNISYGYFNNIPRR